MGVISIGLSLIMLVGITLYTIENSGKNYNEENAAGKVLPFTVEDKFMLAAQVFHVSTILWLSISTIICSVFLIWGTMTKRTRMMFPWLISFALLIAYVFYNFWNIQVEYFTTFKNILGGLLIYSVELLVLGELFYKMFVRCETKRIFSSIFSSLFDLLLDVCLFSVHWTCVCQACKLYLTIPKVPSNNVRNESMLI
jgi:hypothetical protein